MVVALQHEFIERGEHRFSGTDHLKDADLGLTGEGRVHETLPNERRSGHDQHLGQIFPGDCGLMNRGECVPVRQQHAADRDEVNETCDRQRPAGSSQLKHAERFQPQLLR